MRNVTKPLKTALAGLVATTALIGAAQAAGSYTGDANGDVLIKPSAATQAEVKADGDANGTTTPETITGDANGEVKVQPGAAVNAEAKMEAPVSTPKDMIGDANGDQLNSVREELAANADMSVDGMTIMTIDGESIGQVSAVNRDADGRILSIEAEVGGFLGLGSDTITIPSERFTVTDNMVKLNMSEAEVKVLADS